MFGRILPSSAHSSSAFSRTSPSAGFRRTASPARTPRTLAPLISSRLVRARPMPPVKPITKSRAPQAMQRIAVFEYLAADGIVHHVGPAAVGDAFHGVAKRFAAVEHEMIGPLAFATASFSSMTPPRSRSRRASCPSRPRQARRRRRHHAPAALRRAGAVRDRSARDRRCRARPETSRPRHSRRSTATASSCDGVTTASSA